MVRERRYSDSRGGRVSGVEDGSGGGIPTAGVGSSRIGGEGPVLEGGEGVGLVGGGVIRCRGVCRLNIVLGVERCWRRMVGIKRGRAMSAGGEHWSVEEDSRRCMKMMVVLVLITCSGVWWRGAPGGGCGRPGDMVLFGDPFLQLCFGLGWDRGEV